MTDIQPRAQGTETSPDGREWVPLTLDDTLMEIEHIQTHCDGDAPLLLFRGQSDQRWRLDAKFTRSMLRMDQEEDANYPRSVRFHSRVVRSLLAKYGAQWRPSTEALGKQASHGIDAWFELLKHHQQYPEHDAGCPGTHLMDWTLDKDVGLYFATYEGRGTGRQITGAEGALWLLDPVPTGKVWQTLSLEHLLHLMHDSAYQSAQKGQTPLVVCPQHQSLMPRAHAQRPVYVAQMDFRYDLADVWASIEQQRTRRVFVKLILTRDVLRGVAEHLEESGVDGSYVYPD